VALARRAGALAGRREAQARDVFDLYLLVPHESPDELIRYLAQELPTGTLREAHARALGITHEQYVGQVIEFLADRVRATHGNETAWDEMRLHAAGLIESVLKLKEGR
jgi:hypothetical protein